jgi:beta-ureidopropionase / N-carbamoyl-L-amino-acid hydrolase
VADEALGVRLPTGHVRAFVELHVEQGPYLELENAQIGLVSRTTGLRRFRALFSGQRDHAGTTPMNRRHDAGCAAAGTVLAVERIGQELDHSRATTGRVTFTPDAVNVVSERAEILGEFRSPEADWLQHAHDALMTAAQDESVRRGVTVDFEWVPPQEPVPLNRDVGRLCESAVADLGLRRMRLYSGAEHDAAVMARRFPTAMSFVPSHGGRSRCPEEWTDLSDISTGVGALAHSLIRIDQSS